MPDHSEKIPLDSVSIFILTLGNLFGQTWRISLAGATGLDPFHDRGKGRIYTFWHSNLLPMSFYFRHTGKIALVSGSKDGMRAAAVAQRWGHGIIRGSSSHGGASALRVCARELKDGSNLVITPDGPRGPREMVKPGIAQLALFAGAPVVPLTALPSRAWRLKSWDHFMIPAPFTRLIIRLHDPIMPHDEGGGDPVVHLTGLIQKALSEGSL